MRVCKVRLFEQVAREDGLDLRLQLKPEALLGGGAAAAGDAPSSSQMQELLDELEAKDVEIARRTHASVCSIVLWRIILCRRGKVASLPPSGLHARRRFLPSFLPSFRPSFLPSVVVLRSADATNDRSILTRRATRRRPPLSATWRRDDDTLTQV